MQRLRGDVIWEEMNITIPVTFLIIVEWTQVMHQCSTSMWFVFSKQLCRNCFLHSCRDQKKGSAVCPSYLWKDIINRGRFSSFSCNVVNPLVNLSGIDLTIYSTSQVCHVIGCVLPVAVPSGLFMVNRRLLSGDLRMALYRDLVNPREMQQQRILVQKSFQAASLRGCICNESGLLSAQLINIHIHDGKPRVQIALCACWITMTLLYFPT